MEVPGDQVIQGTNDDATASKLWAVKRGYWHDPYIRYFCFSNTPKSPEINRGYFVRSQAFKAITMSFIKSNHGQCQIVNLGAGSDTLFFILREANILPQKFVEVDLLHNVVRKITIIKNKKLFAQSEISTVSEPPSQGDVISSPPQSVDTSTHDSTGRQIALNAGCYHIFCFDLRHPVDELIDRLCNASRFDGPGLDRMVPTLFLAECVLVYMPTDQSFQLLRGLASNFPHAGFLHYEQVNLKDRFGSIMVQHFRTRGCDLPGLSACQSLGDQEKRFLDAGWKRATAWTVNKVYQSFPRNTRQRIEHVEMLDDLEVAEQLFDHYCVLYAVTDETQFPWSDLEEPLAQIT